MEVTERLLTVEELANLALRVLASQQKYFKTRSKDDLIASKELEKRLRQAAEAIRGERETREDSYLKEREDAYLEEHAKDLPWK